MSSRIPSFKPDTGDVRVRVAAIGLSALGTQVAGTIDAVGPESAGFARGDRVAFRCDRPTNSERMVVGERDLIGIPSDVSLDDAVTRFPSALLARTVVKYVHPIGRNTRVRVEDRSAIAPFVRAWAHHLGAVLVDGGADADVVVTAADVRVARAWRGGHGTAQQAAADVFAALRAGAFSGIPLSTPDEARSGSRSPVLLRSTEVTLAA
jgi:NADPH:quinone reductase-like Zn-dependent oxidoreductase